jgi:DNA-binding IscR family transcriptional regulator
MLSKPPAEITLQEIVEPLEGGNHLVDCVRQASVCVHIPTLPDVGERYFSSMLLVSVEKAVASDAVI